MDQFKKCTACSKKWDNRHDFLSDPSIQIVGYMPHFADLPKGLLFFKHEGTGNPSPCGTTFSVPVDQFLDLYQGPKFTDNMHGSPDCGGHCLNSEDLTQCQAKCKNAFVREIIRLIRSYPK